MLCPSSLRIPHTKSCMCYSWSLCSTAVIFVLWYFLPVKARGDTNTCRGHVQESMLHIGHLFSAHADNFLTHVNDKTKPVSNLYYTINFFFCEAKSSPHACAIHRSFTLSFFLHVLYLFLNGTQYFILAAVIGYVFFLPL